MRNYTELFYELQDLQDKVCFVKCWQSQIILTENGYRFKGLTFDDFMQTVGYYNEEMVLDALTNIENEPLKVDKEGYYSFETIMSYDDGEQDEYGRYYARPYLMIEHIEYKYQCSFEEMDKAMSEAENSGEINLFPFL
jgi:hypothetical protein